MQFSFWHILVVVLLIVLLFGRNKVSDLMGDVAVGIKNFKKGLADSGSGKKTSPKRKKAGKGDA
jgi:sec-independent protein translocase protein TatA